jgi:cytochrome P450
MTIRFDPFSAEHRDDPYPLYRELRDRAPVHFSPEAGVYCVSRYEDVMLVLRSHDLFSSRAMFTMLIDAGRTEPPRLDWKMLRFAARLLLFTRLNPFTFPREESLIATDGEVHDRLRAVVNRGFTPRRIAAWETRARELVDGCLAKLRAGSERFDLVQDLAIPLPVTIIAEMLGVEPERRRDFKRWSDQVIDNATGPGRADPFSPRMLRTFEEMGRYVVRVARERRRRPKDDLVSAIVSHEGEGQALSDAQVMQFVTLLLVAGNETTTNLIGNAVAALLGHPAELARVAADPGLVPGAIEETLRYDAPIQIVFRTALRDAEIAGARIPAGATVAPLLGSANRDERRFPDPDRFDVARGPQGHVGFGFGKHFCLGASLARLEARVALEALAPELARLERSEARLPRIDSFMVRGPKRLELRRAA